MDLNYIIVQWVLPFTAPSSSNEDFLGGHLWKLRVYAVFSEEQENLFFIPGLFLVSPSLFLRFYLPVYAKVHLFIVTITCLNPCSTDLACAVACYQLSRAGVLLLHIPCWSFTVMALSTATFSCVRYSMCCSITPA